MRFDFSRNYDPFHARRLMRLTRLDDPAHGAISVESRPGTGSAFTITLPVKTVLRDEVQPIR